MIVSSALVAQMRTGYLFVEVCWNYLGLSIIYQPLIAQTVMLEDVLDEKAGIVLSVNHSHML